MQVKNKDINMVEFVAIVSFVARKESEEGKKKT